MKPKIVSINTKNLKNKILTPGSTAGYQVQEHLEEQGWKLNHGEGPDLKESGIEIKTRKKSSKSAHTIGSMTIENIVTSSYSDSNVSNKFQKQFRVVYDDYGQVLNQKVFDFTDPYIQSEMSKSWELNKEELRKHLNTETKNLPKYIKHENAIFIWEKKKSGRSYSARLTNGVQQKFESISNTNKTRNELFD
jgi:hypothetical protein